MSVNVAEVLKQSMESLVEPERIRDYVAARAGKRITAKNAPEGYRLTYQYGLLKLQTEDFDGNGRGFAFYVPKGQPIFPSAEEFEKANPAEFLGARERNEQRQQLLADKAALAKVQVALDRAAAAAAEYRAAVAALDEVYPWHQADSYDLRKHANLLRAVGNGRIE